MFPEFHETIVRQNAQFHPFRGGGRRWPAVASAVAGGGLCGISRRVWPVMAGPAAPTMGSK